MSEKKTLNPFVIVVDSGEQHAWTFQNIRQLDSRGGGLLDVKTRSESLGRHPNSFGDYSIYGYQQRVAIERKSQEDAYGTILGFKCGRRERFESELSNLSEIPSLVIVECEFTAFLERAPDTGQKSAAENRKILNQSLISFYLRYPIPWVFTGTRRLAEVVAFRFLEKFYFELQGESRGTRVSNSSGGSGTGNNGETISVRDTVRARRDRNARRGVAGIPSAASGNSGGADRGTDAGVAACREHRQRKFFEPNTGGDDDLPF